MAKKTGWDALPKKFQQVDPETGAEPLVPKRLLVKHGLWDEVVEDIMDWGDENTIRACFEEYGCKKAEIDGYFERYELLEEQREIEYRLYDLACRVEKVKPTHDDFLDGEIPKAVIHRLEEWQNSAAGQ